jgi:hypothetical protein
MSESINNPDLNLNEDVHDYFYQITDSEDNISNDTIQTNHVDNNLSTRTNTSENLQSPRFLY